MTGTLSIDEKIAKLEIDIAKQAKLLTDDTIVLKFRDREARRHAQLCQLLICYREMEEAGITDESLIFKSGDLIGSNVFGICDSNKVYSYDKITAEYIEVANGTAGFRISAEGGKVVITKMGNTR